MDRCDNCSHVDECVCIGGRIYLCPRCYSAYMARLAALRDSGEFDEPIG